MMDGVRVPKTYHEMFQFNLAVMGTAHHQWMNEILQSFDAIVTNVANSYRLQEECDIVSLRLAKHAQNNIQLKQYKAVMLASLRSLVPKGWDSKHEESWVWFWENTERMLQTLMGKPIGMQSELQAFAERIDDVLRMQLRKRIYATFFAIAPAGQDFFKQSTTRLHFIADRILEMTVNIFQDPDKMAEEISALGLRHVGYAVPTDLFGAFVSACITVIRELSGNNEALACGNHSKTHECRMNFRIFLKTCLVIMRPWSVPSAGPWDSSPACLSVQSPRDPPWS